MPWIRLLAVAYMACVLLVALIRAHAGSAHAVPSTNAEQRNGLQGRAQHLERVLHHARTAMPWCIKHRRLFNGHAGTRCWWPHYRAAKKARAELRDVRENLATSPAAYGSLQAMVYAIFQRVGEGSNAVRVVDCETGGTWNPALQGGTGGNYWGLFQFGPWARSAYGFSWNPVVQTHNALRLWKATPYWTQWECAYLVGII